MSTWAAASPSVMPTKHRRRPKRSLAQLLERIDKRGHGHRKIVFEPGRSLVGNAGVLVSEVLYVKTGETKNFCIVDAAMNDLLRPAMYDAWMRIVECELRSAPAQLVDVVGPVCESGDWLGHDRRLAVEPGDHVAVLSAGAYAMSMAGNYNSRRRAAEVMVEGEPGLAGARSRNDGRPDAGRTAGGMTR